MDWHVVVGWTLFVDDILHVGPPDPIANVTAVSYNFDILVVQWCPSQPSVNYTLYWALT